MWQAHIGGPPDDEGNERDVLELHDRHHGPVEPGNSKTKRTLPTLGRSSGVIRRFVPPPTPVLTATYWPKFTNHKTKPI